MKAGTLLTRAAIAVLPVAAVSALGGMVTAPNIPGWYVGLAKPPGTPPNWLFAPVWTALYVAMAVAILRILALAPGAAGRGRAIVLFFVQLALNCAWSFAFFGARNPLLGLVVISALLVAIAATIAAFRPLDRIAALLLVPYLAWVLYASWLNVGVWWLNG
jgi:tryptophan-rich sensory protein